MRPNPQETADLATFTEEILNKTSFLCSMNTRKRWKEVFQKIPNHQCGWR